MNDPRDEGCLCQRCKRLYRVDFMLPDELWLKIHGAFNLLCGTCIVELIEGREECDYFDLVKLDAMDSSVVRLRSEIVTAARAWLRGEISEGDLRTVVLALEQFESVNDDTVEEHA